MNDHNREVAWSWITDPMYRSLRCDQSVSYSDGSSGYFLSFDPGEPLAFSFGDKREFIVLSMMMGWNELPWGNDMDMCRPSLRDDEVVAPVRFELGRSLSGLLRDAEVNERFPRCRGRSGSISVLRRLVGGGVGNRGTAHQKTEGESGR
jgi:hypothetical protein